MELIVLIVSVLPYWLVCRCLWYAGTWFKRHSRLYYQEEDNE